MSDPKSDDDGETGSAANRFALPSHADIRVAAEIHSQCQAALQATGDVQIDCGAVERVDAAVLQCVASLAKSLQEGSRQLELVGQSDSFGHAVRLLGYDTVLVANS